MKFNFDLAKVSAQLESKINSWIESGVNMLPNLVVALTVFFLFYLFGKLVRDVYKKVLDRISENKVVNSIVGTGIFVTFSTIGIFTGLSILHLDQAVTSLLAGAGVIGLALGFSFQEIASNFISGVVIAFTKPYMTGDVVQVDEMLGTVLEVNLRTTSIETFEGNEVIVPNKTMFTTKMVNFTSTPKRRIDIKVGVAYSSDLDKVKSVIKNALEGLDGRVKGRKIDVFFREFGESSIDLHAYVWTYKAAGYSYFEAVDECIVSIKKSFDEEGVEIPFPIRTIHQKSL